MNIALERLIEGIVATLRTDVIPNVSDAYARGQAVGIIDLLNNIGPRIEWAQGQIAASVAEKRRLLDEISHITDGAVDAETGLFQAGSAAELLGERDRLDDRLGDAIAALSRVDAKEAGREEALRLLRRHLHDELTREMKITRKPLFAEIASGGEGKATP